MKKSVIVKSLILIALLAVAVFAVVAFSSCAHTHAYNKMSVVQVATCSHVGVQRATCECGDFQMVEIPQLEHTPGDWRVKRAATCIIKGSRELSCKICEEVIKTESIAALGHDFVSYQKKDPTCAEAGHEAYQACTRCDNSTYKEIAALPHTPGAEATCTKPQLCTVCENVVKPAKGHVEVVTTGIPATCNRPGTTDSVFCVVCESVLQEVAEVPKREHTTIVLPYAPSTCTATGRTRGEVCTVCGDYVIEQAIIAKASHKYDGTSDTDCNVCGNIRIVGLSRCYHRNTETVAPYEATCTHYGLTKGSKCVDCGDTIVEQKIINSANETYDNNNPTAPAPHVIEKIPAVHATPTMPGLTEGEFCTVCRMIIKQQEVVPALSRTVTD